MPEVSPSVNQTPCRIRQVNYCWESLPCDRCQRPAERFTTARRTAIDLDLDAPVLLQIVTSVHHCLECQHYFRAQPPFMRPRAIFANRVVDKAVQSVFNDNMALRCAPDRLARDFWVKPSESMIRNWCRTYSRQFDFESDYQPWVVSEFSGILCVDEVYQDRLALLLAVDPAAPDGDRLVGYQLIHGTVDAMAMEQFLSHLKAVGIDPEQIITDGSKLYPAVLRQVWPSAAHQLCLFHETRHVTHAAMQAINVIRKNLPQPPPAPSTLGRGPLYTHPPSEDLAAPASQRWCWRQADRHVKMLQVHSLAEQGLSQRAIARQTGHHRDTVKQWLQQPIPPLPESMPVKLSDLAPLPGPCQQQVRQKLLKHRVHALKTEGLSNSAIAREVGLHRVTVKSWLQHEPPQLNESELLASPEQTTLPPPPAPWNGWEQVRQIHEALREHRFLLLRRPENLDSEEQERLTSLLNSPVGPALKAVRSFLLDWYQLWQDENGCRRPLEDALARYETWRTNPDYHAIPKLRQAQERMTTAKFESLSHFLRHPDWQSTNNGAERRGRTFRHHQASHFNLRTQETIENTITVKACLFKATATRPLSQPFHTCQRGRRKAVCLDG